MNQGTVPETADPVVLGMFWGGVLLSSIPILLGIGIGLFALHRYRTRRPFPARERVRN